MTVTNTIVTGIGSSDTIINNEGGGLSNLNTAAQLSAAAAGLGEVTSTGGAVAAITAGEAAFATGSAVLAADIQNSQSNGTIAADLLTLAGDASLVVGGVASTIPGGKGVALIADDIGEASTLIGVGINNWDAVVANTPVALGELKTELSENIDSMENTLSYNLVGASQSVEAAWSSTETKFSNALTSMSTAVSDLGTSNFDSAANTASTNLSNVESSSTSTFDATGVASQNVTDTVTNNSFSLSSGSNPTMSGNATFGANGSTTGLTTTSNNSINDSETETIGSTTVNDSVQNNGTSIFGQNILTQSSGTISASVSGQGDTANIDDASISIATGTQAAIDGVNNAVTLAANAALSFAAGATNNTATITGSGDTVNIAAAGGAVGPSVLTKVGTSEECSTTFDMAVVSNGVQATVVGTDGTDTINNNSANNGIQSTINWNAGGSEQQLYTSLGNGEASQFNNYSGASATGTDLNNILNMTNGTSMDEIMANLPGNELEQINYFSGFDDSGTHTQTELNFTNDTSQAQLLTGLPSGDKEFVDSYSGLNSSGALGSTIWNYTNNASQIEWFNPNADITNSTADFTGLNGGGAEEQRAANDNQPQGALLLRRAS